MAGFLFADTGRLGSGLIPDKPLIRYSVKGSKTTKNRHRPSKNPGGFFYYRLGDINEKNIICSNPAWHYNSC